MFRHNLSKNYISNKECTLIANYFAMMMPHLQPVDINNGISIAV